MHRYVTTMSIVLAAAVWGCGGNTPANTEDTPDDGPGNSADALKCYGDPLPTFCFSKTGDVDGPFMEVYFYATPIPGYPHLHEVCGTVEARGSNSVETECSAVVTGTAVGEFEEETLVKWGSESKGAECTARGVKTLLKSRGEMCVIDLETPQCAVSECSICAKDQCCAVDGLADWIDPKAEPIMYASECNRTPAQFCDDAKTLNAGTLYYGVVTSCEDDKYSDKEALVAAMNKVQGRDAFTVPLCYGRPKAERKACTNPGNAQSLPSELEKFKGLLDASPADRDALCEANAVATAAQLQDYLSIFSKTYGCGF